MAPIFTGSKFGFGRSAEAPLVRASGGTINDNGATRTHTFTGAGTFKVLDPALAYVEVFAIGGGGGAGGTTEGNTAGAGGAGGAVYYTSYPVSVSPGEYSVVVGGGGAGSPNGGGVRGTDSSFGPAIGLGGAGGAGWQNSPEADPGGCGAGGGGYLAAETNGLQPSQPQPVPGYTNYGGNGGGRGGAPNPGSSAGGGGIGGNGGQGANGGPGGAGLQFPQFDAPLIGLPDLAPFNGFFGGGGAGRHLGVTVQPASAGGGGLYPGLSPTNNPNGFQYTGGGGASGGSGPPVGGNGGTGIVLVRYPA